MGCAVLAGTTPSSAFLAGSANPSKCKTLILTVVSVVCGLAMGEIFFVTGACAVPLTRWGCIVVS